MMYLQLGERFYLVRADNAMPDVTFSRRTAVSEGIREIANNQ